MRESAGEWSTKAQAIRVARSDTALTGIDAVYALGYVLAAFYVMPPSAASVVHVVAAPFLALALIVGYLMARICGPERDDTTAMFYANLPRDRGLTYWVHAAGLSVFVLAMEIVILTGTWMRLNAVRADQVFVITPTLVVLPFLMIGFLFWVAYDEFNWFTALGASFLVLVPVAGMIVIEILSAGRGADKPIFSYVLATGFALLAGALLWYGHWCWKRRQIGELS